MQITFFSEDTPNGLTADWPFIPREGEIIAMQYAHGTDRLRVDWLDYVVSEDGTLEGVDIGLTY